MSDLVRLPEEWHGGSLPPGTPPPKHITLELECINLACPGVEWDKETSGTWYGDRVTWEADAVEELGAICPDNEDDWNCPECGEEGKPL